MRSAKPRRRKDDPMSTVVLGMVDKEALKDTMGLRPGQHVHATQPVGPPPQAD